jgi:hypothetical protein
MATNLHAFTGEICIVLQRDSHAHSAAAMESYLKELVTDSPELLTHGSVDVTVTPVPCGVPCSICDAPSAVLRDLRVANLREYLVGEAHKIATPAQRRRMQSAETSADETLAVVRGELFKPFLHLTKRMKRYADSIPHAAHCRSPLVGWSTTSGTDLNTDEKVALAQVMAAASVAARHEWLTWSTDGPQLEVKVQGHVGMCACGGRFIEHGALVSIPWGERTLSREYLL